jgi:flavin-dependent dehydrogenase
LDTNYDILVVGSGTAGVYFAHEAAKQGYSVCVLDAAPIERLGERLNVFHTDTERFAPFGVPEPKPGDDDYVGMFEYGYVKSALDNYPKRAEYPFTVALLPPFLKRMRKWAEEAGAEFVYGTRFEDFTYDADGRINGAEFTSQGKPLTLSSRLVVDCSGIPSAARRKLKCGVSVENFEITQREQFYVILRYVKFKNPEKDRITINTAWPYFKAWTAPAIDPDGAIVGIGANLSYEYAETCFQRFQKVIKLPEYDIDHIERGVTPYRRAPYSFVTDGFICLGDAACMTKPFSGEGITSGWVGCKIAADVACRVMKDGAYPTEEKLWDINVVYNTTQGADFAYVMATLINAVECSPQENDYEFKKGIVFNSKALTRTNRNFNADTPVGESLALVGKIAGGVIGGKIRFKTVKTLSRGILLAGQFKSLYKKFPSTPAGFAEWREKADKLWRMNGTMADVVERMESEQK